MVETINIDKQFVEKSIADWKKRVLNLYSEIDLWLKGTAYSIKLHGKTEMYEELMFEFDVPPIQIETAGVYKDNKLVLGLRPKGLWAISANGLLDISTKFGAYSIKDTAEQFETPHWNIYIFNSKKWVDFDKYLFFQLLKYKI